MDANRTADGRRCFSPSIAQRRTSRFQAMMRIRAGTALVDAHERRADYPGCGVKITSRIVEDRSTVTAVTASTLGTGLKTSPEFQRETRTAIHEDGWCGFVS